MISDLSTRAVFYGRRHEEMMCLSRAHGFILKRDSARVKRYKQIHVRHPSLPNYPSGVLFVLLLVSVLSQALFTLVSRDLMSFSLSSARHNQPFILDN